MPHRNPTAKGFVPNSSEQRGLGERPIAEDDFFRQLAGGTLADDQPAAGSPGAKSTGIPRQDGHPLLEPPVRGGEPAGRGVSPQQSGSSPPPGGGGTARYAALAALALICAALAALLFGSSGGQRPVKRPAEAGEQRGRPNGRPAAGDARLSVWWPGARRPHERALGVRWRPGGRAVIAGRLTSAGGGSIAGARISVLAADGGEPGQRGRSVGEVRSDREGRFAAAIALDRGASRKLLTFAYLPPGRDKLPAATARARLEVAGTISARTPARRTRRGRSVRLEGHSPAGATVQVLVGQPGARRWRIHSSVRASRTGRWEAGVYIPSYGPMGRYRLRARVLGDDRRGFLSAASPPSSVQVR